MKNISSDKNISFEWEKYVNSQLKEVDQWLEITDPNSKQSAVEMLKSSEIPNVCDPTNINFY